MIHRKKNIKNFFHGGGNKGLNALNPTTKFLYAFNHPLICFLGLRIAPNQQNRKSIYRSIIQKDEIFGLDEGDAGRLAPQVNRKRNRPFLRPITHLSVK